MVPFRLTIGFQMTYNTWIWQETLFLQDRFLGDGPAQILRFQISYSRQGPAYRILGGNTSKYVGEPLKVHTL